MKHRPFQKCILRRNIKMEEKRNSIILGGPKRTLLGVPGGLDSAQIGLIELRFSSIFIFPVQLKIQD